jgi:energy-coupling factor transporter ATP-binding protein EcfA2
MEKEKITQKILTNYQDRVSNYSGKKEKIAKRLNILILLRLTCFLALVYGTYKIGSENMLYGGIFFIVLFSLFIFIVIKHLKTKYNLSIIENLIDVNKKEIEALRGQIGNFEHGQEFNDPNHEYSNDLELFGDKNLFQFLNRTSTYSGKNQLAHWLLNPLQNKDEIKKRQEGIKEIKDMIEWRQRFAAIGHMIKIKQYDDGSLISWSKEEHHMPRESFLRLFIYLSPFLILGSLTLYILGLIPIGYTILLLLVNRGVLFKYSRDIMNFHTRVTNQLKTLKNYSRLFRHIEKKEFKSSSLGSLKEDLSTQASPSSMVIHKLYKITDALDASSNIFVELFLNTIFFYNIHLVFRLESWHKKNAASIEKWLVTVGNFDAYSSLGNYYYNNSDFTFPTLNESVPLKAKQIGHPLIGSQQRVSNSFDIDEKGKVFIITGANMAGKSTFLRTIGVNLVLAMNGAPVCAEELQFKITRIFTSMTITDSLAMNQSYFYAEVKRLRQLIDMASSAENILVLLDEILTGTNTRDKEIASKEFLKRLIKLKITSIIATHDLSLTTLEKDYPEKIQNKSFEVDMINGEMKYDYTIRDGIAKNMNALELLRNMKLIP